MLREGLIYLSESGTAKKVLTGLPMTRSMSRRFVPGETVDSLVDAIREANAAGMTATANYLGESEKNEANARAAGDVYMDILRRIHDEGLDANVSMKFTQLGQAIGEDFLTENLERVLKLAKAEDTFVRFDMESSDYVDRTLKELERFWAAGWRNIGVVLQSYLHRTMDDARRLVDMGVRVRICKGAYNEPPDIAFQERDEVDGNFLDVSRLLIAEGNYPGIATHDERMIEGVLEFVTKERIPADRFEFQMLHGVRRDLQKALVSDGYRVRVYVPFGGSWYPYLMRRLAERPANMLFMAGSVVKESPLGFLWPDRKKRRNGA
jgi:proline dehydrogenase